jgi:hypothetical protein
MCSKAIKWCKKHKRVFKRAGYELLLPAIAGIIWALIAVRKSDLFASISFGGAAFFFVFSMQGQVLRMAKNVRDEDNADEWRTSFNTLHEGVEELRRQRGLEPNQPEFQAHPAGFSEPFIVQAQNSLGHHLYYPAVLTAAVGFEQTLRLAAEYMKLDTKRPMSVVARELGAIVKDNKLTERLITLVRLRNGVVHPRRQGAHITRDEAELLVSSFEEGTRLLEKFLTSYYTGLTPGITY